MYFKYGSFYLSLIFFFSLYDQDPYQVYLLILWLFQLCGSSIIVTHLISTGHFFLGIMKRAGIFLDFFVFRYLLLG